jgi:hypothetical protein
MYGVFFLFASTAWAEDAAIALRRDHGSVSDILSISRRIYDLHSRQIPQRALSDFEFLREGYGFDELILESEPQDLRCGAVLAFPSPAV